MGLREEATDGIIDSQPSHVLFTEWQWETIQSMLNQACDKWEPLLREWLETHDEPCRLDHHGYCQEHFLEEDCIVKRTREALQ